MKKSFPKYTVLRGETYWLNYKLPIALFRLTSLSMQVIKSSLKTKHEEQAGAYAQVAALKINEYCSSITPNDITKESIELVIKAALESLGVNTQSNSSKVSTRIVRPKTHLFTNGHVNNELEIRLSEAFQLYKEEMLIADLWRVKTQHDIEAAIRTLIELVGNSPLSCLTPPVCRDYKSLLLKYPIHRYKDLRFKDKAFLNILKSDIPYSTLSITTINNQIRKVSTFFNWLVKQGYINSNPIVGMRVKQKVSPKSARLPFSDDNLKELFNSTIYTDHKFSKDYKYWLPLLGLYTGARLEELCQLRLNDINVSATIPYFNITDEHPEQHLKNNSSRREIPIHPELLALGFDKFIQERIVSNSSKLFDYLIPQRQKLGHKPSIWFGKYKLAQGINDRKKVFHSFRHTLVANLIKLKAPAYELKSLLGHQHGSITFDLYGSDEVELQPIHEMLVKLSFKDVLKNVKSW
jgi:integrase